MCLIAGWLFWNAKPSHGAPIAFASHPDWPKNLAELNQWYAKPPAGQNAAEVFIKGYDALTEQINAHAHNNDVNLPLVGKAAVPRPGGPVPPAMKKAIADYMQQNQSAWDLFQQGSSLPQSRYPVGFSKGSEATLPHLTHVKQASQLLAVFALGYADTHRAKEAGESLLSGYAIGRSLEAEPVLISQMARGSSVAITSRSLEQMVNRVALPPQTLTQLQDVLGRMADREAGGENFNRALLGEMVEGLAHFDMSPEELQKAQRVAGVIRYERQRSA